MDGRPTKIDAAVRSHQAALATPRFSFGRLDAATIAAAAAPRAASFVRGCFERAPARGRPSRAVSEFDRWCWTYVICV